MIPFLKSLLPSALASGGDPFTALLGLVPLAILIGTMVWGFKIAGRMAKTVPMQVLLGFVLGILILIGVVCVLCGVLFAGCLILGSPSFH